MEYSSLPSVFKPSRESIFGMELEGACLLCGAIVLAGFSTATSPMFDNCSDRYQKGCCQNQDLVARSWICLEGVFVDGIRHGSGWRRKIVGCGDKF